MEVKKILHFLNILILEPFCLKFVECYIQNGTVDIISKPVRSTYFKQKRIGCLVVLDSMKNVSRIPCRLILHAAHTVEF